MTDHPPPEAQEPSEPLLPDSADTKPTPEGSPEGTSEVAAAKKSGVVLFVAAIVGVIVALGVVAMLAVASRDDTVEGTGQLIVFDRDLTDACTPAGEFSGISSSTEISIRSATDEVLYLAPIGPGRPYSVRDYAADTTQRKESEWQTDESTSASGESTEPSEGLGSTLDAQVGCVWEFPIELTSGDAPYHLTATDIDAEDRVLSPSQIELGEARIVLGDPAAAFQPG